MTKVWFITGASSGLGQQLAEQVLESGDKAVITARRLPALEKTASKFGDRALPIRLDVTDAASRESAVATALDKFGRIDVVVNNAGRSCVGAIEEYSSDQFRNIVELNLFAPYELTNLILPTLRKQRSGCIVNVSSISGLICQPAIGPYSVAKYGFEAYSETLSYELKDLGIKTLIVEPGAFRTEVWSNEKAVGHIDDYDTVTKPIEEWINGMQKPSDPVGDPRKAALCVIKAVNDPKAPLRLMLGRDAFELYGQATKARDTDILSWREHGEDTLEDI